jgi:hypothetical protein
MKMIDLRILDLPMEIIPGGDDLEDNTARVLRICLSVVAAAMLC